MYKTINYCKIKSNLRLSELSWQRFFLAIPIALLKCYLGKQFFNNLTLHFKHFFLAEVSLTVRLLGLCKQLQKTSLKKKNLIFAPFYVLNLPG